MPPQSALSILYDVQPCIGSCSGAAVSVWWGSATQCVGCAHEDGFNTICAMRQAHEKEGYKWWARRLGRVFSMHNETRIDHFRGFAGEKPVERSEKTHASCPVHA